MKLQNVTDEIKNKWLLLKTAIDYIKFGVDTYTEDGANQINLIGETLNAVDYILGMLDKIDKINKPRIKCQNECEHNSHGSPDGILRIIDGDDGQIMFRCELCKKHIPIPVNVPTPEEMDMTYEQIRDFITVECQTQKPDAQETQEILDSLGTICSKYRKMYEKYTNSHNHNTEVK